VQNVSEVAWSLKPEKNGLAAAAAWLHKLVFYMPDGCILLVCCAHSTGIYNLAGISVPSHQGETGRHRSDIARAACEACASYCWGCGADLLSGRHRSRAPTRGASRCPATPRRCWPSTRTRWCTRGRSGCGRGTRSCASISSHLLHRLEKVTVPFLVLHGTADRVTDPLASRELYGAAASAHKDLRLYDGFLHDLLFEPERDEVGAEIVAWMDGMLRLRRQAG
jgi:pimeloyl-ACP methyl ester carboxylesterase